MQGLHGLSYVAIGGDAVSRNDHCRTLVVRAQLIVNLPHARDDFKDRDDKEWMKHTISYMASTADKVKIDYRPVHSQPLDDEMEHVPPKARVY